VSGVPAIFLFSEKAEGEGYVIGVLHIFRIFLFEGGGELNNLWFFYTV
jgi:hypothetical protein